MDGDAREDRRAGHAGDLGEGAVELDDVHAAGALVEAVDVLGDQTSEQADSLHLGERVMASVRLGLTEATPANDGAGPVALS